MRVQETVELARPPDEVWRFVAEPANDPRWCPKVIAVQPLERRTWDVLHKPVPFRAAVHLRVEHLIVEAPKLLRLQEEDDASVFTIEYKLAPRGVGGTEFTQTSEFEWKKLPRFLHGVFARGVRRDVRRQLANLKAHFEES